MEKLRYNKIKNFVKDLNAREQRYLAKKLNEKISESEINIVNFTINGREILKL